MGTGEGAAVASEGAGTTGMITMADGVAMGATELGMAAMLDSTTGALETLASAEGAMGAMGTTGASGTAGAVVAMGTAAMVEVLPGQLVFSGAQDVMVTISVS